MNNIHAFKALILKYESITQDMINGCDSDSNESIAEQLTGFGGTQTCTLCISAKKQNDNHHWDKDGNYFCNNCIWRKYTKRASGLMGYDCLDSEHGIYVTWSLISEHPDQPEHYHERAKLMRSVLKELGYKQP